MNFRWEDDFIIQEIELEDGELIDLQELIDIETDLYEEELI